MLLHYVNNTAIVGIGKQKAAEIEFHGDTYFSKVSAIHSYGALKDVTAKVSDSASKEYKKHYVAIFDFVFNIY